MKEKKTAVITFRTEEWLKNDLQEVANQRGFRESDIQKSDSAPASCSWRLFYEYKRKSRAEQSNHLKM